MKIQEFLVLHRQNSEGPFQWADLDLKSSFILGSMMESAPLVIR